MYVITNKSTMTIWDFLFESMKNIGKTNKRLIWKFTTTNIPKILKMDSRFIHIHGFIFHIVIEKALTILNEEAEEIKINMKTIHYMLVTLS